MAEIQVICKDCQKEFTLSDAEQKYFLQNGLVLPKRCLACRRARKKSKRDEQKQKQWEEDEKELQTILGNSAYPQMYFADIAVSSPQNTLFILGNGFDLLHGVQSTYYDFQKTLGCVLPWKYICNATTFGAILKTVLRI